jgi:hypothetical protein
MSLSTLMAVAVSAALAARTAFCIDAPSTATPSAVAPVFSSVRRNGLSLGGIFGCRSLGYGFPFISHGIHLPQ